MKSLHIVAFILVIVGAINWGLIGLLRTNLITGIFGSVPVLEQLVYVAVGASAVYFLATHAGECKACKAKK